MVAMIREKCGLLQLQVLYLFNVVCYLYIAEVPPSASSLA